MRLSYIIPGIKGLTVDGSLAVDKSFDFIIKRTPVAAQIMELGKIAKGSGESNRKKVGKITWEQVRKIAEDKMVDMNCSTVESAMKRVAGTARRMGVRVTGQDPVNKN